MPDTPRNIPKGRALQDFLPLLPAEEKLRLAVREGEECVITSTRPECRTQENTVRAEFLRFLALGGDAECPVHETGIILRGVWVIGMLDLSGCTLPKRFGAIACRFEQKIVLEDTHAYSSLAFSASHINGINGCRLIVEGSVFLSGNDKCGFISTDEINMQAAESNNPPAEHCREIS